MRRRRRLLFWRWLGASWFVLRLLVSAGTVLMFAGRAIYWLATSPWRDVRAVLILVVVAAALSPPLVFIITRLERKPSCWSLGLMMLLLLAAAIIFIFVVVALDVVKM